MTTRVYDIVGDPRAGGPFVFSCEHAGRELPEWEPEARERPLVDDHWGWDIGAADLTRELAQRTGSCAVLSRFSRLVCDPNRDPGEASFVVEAIDGAPLSFNRGVDAAERSRRRRRYFDPYHEALDRCVAARLSVGSSAELCAVHSFTPRSLGSPRTMEVGVLFDAHEARARAVAEALAGQGFATALNRPYSGYEGLIYSAARHGRTHGLVYFELEVRQDLIDSAPAAAAVADRISAALGATP